MAKDYVGEWLNIPCRDDKKKYKYDLYRITKKSDNISTLIKDLQDDLIYSYREKDFLQDTVFTTFTKDQILTYVKGMIPEDSDNIAKNVRTGDFGEVLVKSIVSFFYNFTAYNKLKFKFNKNRSVFATDLLAFDNLNDPKSIHFYEIKTRQSLNKEDGFYITEIAYDCLENDSDNVVHPVLDFMAQRFFSSGEKDLSAKYLQLALDRHSVKSYYEIFILTNDINESKISKICDALNNLNLKLKPLSLTLVLVPELYTIKNEVWNTICDRFLELSGKV